MKSVFKEFKYAFVDFVEVCWDLLILKNAVINEKVIIKIPLLISLWIFSLVIILFLILIFPILIPYVIYIRLRAEEDLVWDILKGKK